MGTVAKKLLTSYLSNRQQGANLASTKIKIWYSAGLSFWTTAVSTIYCFLPTRGYFFMYYFLFKWYYASSYKGHVQKEVKFSLILKDTKLGSDAIYFFLHIMFNYDD